MKELTYNCMTGHELEILIKENVAPLTDNPEGYKDFEPVEAFHWDNYARYTTSEVFRDEKMADYNLKYIMEGKPTGLYWLILFMVQNLILPEGRYLIDPSW